MKAALTVAVALIVGLALAACGSSQEPGSPAAPAGVQRAPAAATVPCRIAVHGALRVHGIGCAAAGRIVRGFAAEGGSPGTILTVDDFVCQERGRWLSCARGSARILYEAPH